MIKKINVSSEFSTLENLVDRLQSPEQSSWNIDKVSPWHNAFRDYVNKFKYTEETFETLISNETYFRSKLTQFLYSPRGMIFQPYFWWSQPLVCGEPAPDLLLQAVPFTHKRFARSAEWIPAMREVQRIVRETQFSNSSFPMSLAYVNWETDAIVGIELVRNIGIALGNHFKENNGVYIFLCPSVCIFITTLVTLGSWRGSLLVMMCVLLTCTDVAGFMHWWGLTIDMSSMNVLIISVGLCVDFCAHIVHGFLTGRGSKEERVLYVMENIAPAVLNGGFSTLLALSLLVTSKSHVAMSFFKIFFMICVFGLFHGLVLLPTVLCMVGPSDDEMVKLKQKKVENGQTPILKPPKKVKESEKYRKENEKNLQRENGELGLPLNPQTVESFMTSDNVRETALV